MEKITSASDFCLEKKLELPMYLMYPAFPLRQSVVQSADYALYWFHLILYMLSTAVLS